MFDDKELKPIPYSDCFVNSFSEIVDSNNQRLDYKNECGALVATFNWYDGIKEYPVSLVVVVTRLNIKIPPYLFEQIEVLYKDRNKNNVFSSNLYYRFKSPILVKGCPGFFYIPFYTNYAINIRGALLNLRTMKRHSWYITKPAKGKNIKGGYYVSRARRDVGLFGSLSRHRAICLTFKMYDNCPFTLVVNHLNGRPGDDWVDNLEWTTYSKNNQHAYDTGLIKNGVVKVLCKDINSGIVTEYTSMAHAARALGKRHSVIVARIKKSHRRYEDGLSFKVDDGSPWPVLEDKITKTPVSRRIMARNIFTGKVYISETADGLSKLLGIERKTILLAAVTEKIPPNFGFNFRFIHDFNGWPNHHSKSLQIYKDHPRDPSLGFEILDSTGKELGFFTSDKSAAEYLSISAVTIRKRAQHNLCINGIIVKYFNPLNNLGPPI